MVIKNRMVLAKLFALHANAKTYAKYYRII